MRLQGFAEHVVATNLFGGRDMHAGPGAGPAFDEPFRFQTGDGIADGHRAHSQGLGETSPGDGRPRRQMAAENGFA
jgi:hypothetical protein